MFFKVPRGVLQKLDYYRLRFFWQCDEHKKKYRLARWGVLCNILLRLESLTILGLILNSIVGFERHGSGFFCGTKTLLIIKEYHHRQETKQTQAKKQKRPHYDPT